MFFFLPTNQAETTVRTKQIQRNNITMPKLISESFTQFGYLFENQPDRFLLEYFSSKGYHFRGLNFVTSFQLR